jgi:glycosyltransferase involved in cell wall biosynthesis
MSPVPLLLLSDAPTAVTGLARITKDLATRIHAHLPEFRVGTLGYGGPFQRGLGFPQYRIDMQDWVVNNLPEVWEDFAGNEKGVLLSIWDSSRLQWLSRPQSCPDSQLREFLCRSPFRKWGYFPIDATGPHGKLTESVEWIINGYDRVLAYSVWAEEILRRTLKRADLLKGMTNLPHGLDTSVFYPRPRVQARHSFGPRSRIKWLKGDKTGSFFTIPDDALMIGIVGTNQTRKDWATALAAVAEIAKTRSVRIWCHIDRLENVWSIPSLLNDFGLTDFAGVSATEYTDEEMAWLYSACDVTIGHGLGEGYGYCLFESLACGCPVVHGNYGGGAEHLPPEMLTEEVAERIEGPYNCIRKVYSPKTWAEAALRLAQSKQRTTLPPHLDWNNLWPRWAEWLKAGL